MTHISMPPQDRINYPVVVYDPHVPVSYIDKNDELWVLINDKDALSFSAQDASFLTDLVSRISQHLKNAGTSAFRGVVYAAHFGKELSARAIVSASTTLSNNEENIRSTLLATAQMANSVAQLAAGQGRHALAALGYASMQAGETIIDSAKRHGPSVGNALLHITTQAAHSATRFAADQGPVVIKAIGTFGDMSVQATGTFVAAARHYGPEIIGCAQNMLSFPTIKLEAVSYNFPLQRIIRSPHDSNNMLIEMSTLARIPQSASLEVIDDAENEIGNLQPAKDLSEDVDPLLGRIPLMRSPNPRQDTAIASQSQTLNADTQAEPLSAPHAKPAPVSKGLFKRFFTSIQDGLATIFNGARTVVFSIADALLSVMTFKWLRGH